MTGLKVFTFNAFQENTFILYDETRECIIIDAGCSSLAEQEEVEQFLESNQLKLVKMVNTHCHIDHILGNQFIKQKFGVDGIIHKLELPLLASASEQGLMFGLDFKSAPAPDGFIEEGEQVTFGNTKLDVLLTPGHSPGSISLYNAAKGYVIAGDALFAGSIGRTDLPGGDYETLITSIQSKLMTLPGNVEVYPGHGPPTTIDREKTTNPFLT